MNPLERRSLWFIARSVIVFCVLLMPIPWLADTYVSCAGRLMNAVMVVADAFLPASARFEFPEAIRRDGSWKGIMRLEPRDTGRTVRLNVDFRSLSYRSVAAFIALAAASLLRDRRRSAILWSGGVAAMAAWTIVLVILALFSRFALAGAIGGWSALFVRTAYQALATPVMVFVVPAATWACLVVATRRRIVPAPAATP